MAWFSAYRLRMICLQELEHQQQQQQQQQQMLLGKLAIGSQQNKDAMIAANALPALVSLLKSDDASVQGFTEQQYTPLLQESTGLGVIVRSGHPKQALTQQVLPLTQLCLLTLLLEKSKAIHSMSIPNGFCPHSAELYHNKPQ